MDTNEKLDLITRDLEEVIGYEDLQKIASERSVKIYLGTATTGKPHLGYFVWVLKMADFLKAESEVTLLFADLHAYLDNMKSSWELLEHRIEFYKLVITKMLEIAGVDTAKLKYVKGTDYQLSREYTLDMYKAAVTTSLRDAQKAGAEVVKQVESPILGSMLYPILQALDEQYLDVDAQMGGLDQRKIFTFARDLLPRMGYKKRIHFLTKLIPGLTKSGKMSSSEPNSKIDFDDSEEAIKEKFERAYSVDKQVEGNGLLAIAKFVLLRIDRPEKWGGAVSYKDYASLEADFAEGKVSSVDLKPTMAREIIEIIKPIQKPMTDNQELISKAYPE
jgi:tyrosyl-tRNA synthetase